MRKTILALVLAAMSSGVWAEWVKVHESDEAIFYLDPPTIRKNGNLRRVWEIQDLKERDKDGEMSRRLLDEFDCTEERIRILSLSFHSGPMARGKIMSLFSTTGDWMYVAPNTSRWVLLKFVCAQ